MTNLITYIQQHLSLRLGLLILVVVGGVFGVSLGLLFYQTKQKVKEEAVRHATLVLDETVNKISNIMDHTEAVTASMERRAIANLQPDSLLSLTRQMLEEQPDVYGFTIAMKPDFFPSKGRCYSAYSLRQGDSITTVVEDKDYFEQIWYKSTWDSKRPLWLEPYIDDTPRFLTSSEYNYSYIKPLYTSDGTPIGVLCTDLLLKWLSQTVTEVKPFPHSSAIMLGHDGRYIVHPDTAKLVRQSIFSDPDPEARQDIIPLGQSMLAGQSGIWAMKVDGQPAHVFYRPLPRTGWSIAIVCPDSDVFSGYYQVLNIALAVIGLSLLLLLLFCYQIIRHAIVPLNQLATSAQRITDRHFDEQLPHSNRLDTVGRLQNSFILMLQSLNSHINKNRQMNDEMEQHNQELQQAYQLVREADQQKTEFVQDMAHQIRTPLNIISGFTQVISSSYQDFPEDVLTDITTRMKSSANTISRITKMLGAASASPQQENSTREFTAVACNALCREAVESVSTQKPETVTITIESNVPDDFTIQTDRKGLFMILVELLGNAIRFAPEGSITIGCKQLDKRTVTLTVSDTGAGIAPADRSRIFNQFTKLDSFSEGIGLGLPLSRQKARLLGGELTLDENYTDGTRFIVTLPIGR